ncbi:MAG TPA: TIGR03668 family PPOX class F420-dependent oxidoreductase [Actinobacteria bacterium]|nr:TIGR03668 family PPOX class F420-dependent oxidoreductase [Actinomycetota bacterium]
MDVTEARRRFAAARVARLATIGPRGPRIVPITFAVVGDRIVTAVDHKPKTSRRLARLDDVRADPRVAILVDHWDDDDWTTLWWVRADGVAEIVTSGPRFDEAVAALVARYPQYAERPPAGPVIDVTVTRWRAWTAAESP